MKISRSVLSVTTAIIFLLTAVTTQMAMAADPFKIYKSANFKGKVSSYGIGQHEFHVGGDSKTMGSFKIPAGLAVTFYDASGCKGGKSYGPFTGRYHGTKVTGSHGFTSRSIHCFKVVDVGSTKLTWRIRKTGNIVHGRGSYYTTEKDVTLEFKGIKTEAAALKKVQELASKNPSNPPVMWQLSNFPGKRDGHLIVHLKKFMSKPLVRAKHDTVDCYTAFHAEYGKTDVHPVRVSRGKGAPPTSPPLHYLSDPAEAKRSCKTDSYSADGCPSGTVNLTYGGFAAGADIGGCGLDRCTARMAQKNVNECRDWCKERDDCKSFTWADTNEDKDWPGDQVCTRYGSTKPNQRWQSTDGVHRQILCAYVKTGGVTVGSFSSATSTAAGTGQFNIYKFSNFKGKVNSYGIGQHEFHVGGDSKTMGSFKVPAGLAVTFYDAPGCKDEGKKGRKSYGPFKGRFHGTKVTGSHGFTSRSIHCFKVTDISTKAKREEEAKKRAKAEADKKAAVAKAKAAAELAKKKEECKADVVFLMDNTGSMGSVIKATKRSAANILNKISGADPRFKGLNVKFGVATYWGDPKEHKCETKATDVKLYQHWHYGGKEKGYKVGKHAWIGDTYSGYLGLSSFKVPKGLSVYFWQGRDFKKTMYGPYKGPLDIPCLANRKGDGCPHSDIPNDHIHSIEVVTTSALPPKTKAGCAAYKGKQCYWMENTSGNYCFVPPSKTPSWTRSSDGFERCKALDSCDGGGGLSGGGCYKFAECSDCKRMPWSGTGGSFSSATRTSSSTKTAGGVTLYSHPGYNSRTTKFAGGAKDGREKQYGAGDYPWIGDLFPADGWFGASAMKVPSGYSIEMYEGRNFTGKKYGPIKGPRNYEDLNVSPIPQDLIVSIKVTGGSSKKDTGDGYQECARKAYKVNQPLTKSKESAASAMNQWEACSVPGGCGEDIPEANFFALHQLATEGEITDGKGTSDKGFASGYKVGWREDAGRVVVWFGDAPSHTTTVDKEEAVSALLDNEIVVSAINTKDKYTGLDSSGGIEGIGGLPHFCSIKSCLFSGKDAWMCDYYACEKGGICSTEPEYDCSVLDKANPPGQATQITVATRGKVHHRITGGGKVVKTILEATAVGIADAGVGSAVTFTGGFLARDSKVFFGTMNPKGWSGDVQAWPLDEETAAILVTRPLGGMVWSAAEKIDAGSPTSRVMLSYQRAVTDAKGVTTPGEGIALRWDELSDEQKADIQSNHKGEVGDEKEGEKRLSFLRGDRTDEGKGYGFRIRDSRLGDIWHSSPVHVGAPRKPRWMPRIKSKEAVDMFRAYLSFVRTSGGREPIVYVGANDGALHGFNAKTGEEVLSYFPASLYASLKDSKGGGYHKLANPEYAHTDYVDATPSVFDAYFGDDGSSEWRTVLVGSLGGGGRGFFGLDVTDPSAFSEANADDIVLGEFSNADDDHLGYSYSKARLGKMNNGRWAVIIGNGLDDTATDESGGQAQLFIVYIDGDVPGDDGKWDLGKDYIRIATGKGSAEAGSRNGLFTPTIVDINGDGTIDRVYAGDLQGNLWAFDLSSKSPGAWKVALGKKPLLKAAGNRPITAAPLVVRPDYRAMGRTPRDTPGLMVMFGTGRFLKDRDKVYTDPQRFYAIYDRGIPIKKVKSQLVEQPLRQSTVKTATGETRKIRLTKGKLKVPYSHSKFPKYGWYINLPEKGERVVSEAKFQRGVVYFNSIVPDISVCSSGGEGWEMAVKLVNGGNPKAGNHDVNEDEKVDGDDAAKEGGDEAPAGKRLEGRGMPTGPMLFGDRRFTATSKVDADGSYLPETTALERIGRERQGRLSWEELQPRQ